MSSFVHYSTKVKDYRPCDTTPDKCKYGAEDHHPITSGQSVQQAIEEANEKRFAGQSAVGEGKSKKKAPDSVEEETDGDAKDKEYDVHRAAFEKVKESVKKNNRRLERAGISERFEVNATQYTDVVKDEFGRNYTDDRVKFTLNHPRISYNGYQFLARVEEVSEGNFVAYSAPNVDMEGWRPESMECEYCHKNIARNKVYVVADEDGNKKVVGGKCVELYTGLRPSNLWSMEYAIEDDLEESDFAPSERGSANRAESTDSLLSVAYVISKDEGYRSASYYADSTSMKVDNVLNPPSRISSSDKAWNHSVMEEAKKVDVAAIKEEVREAIQDANNDWAHNLRTLMNEEYVNNRGRGTVISAMAALHKQREKKRQKEQWAKGFIGAKGEKVKDIKAKVVKSETVEESYGYRPTVATKLTMQTPDGHRVFWKTSSANVPQAGDDIVFSATIKDTSTWQEVDSTRVIRAKWKAQESDDS